MDYGYLTLVAPILTLAVAIATRKVPLAMLVGIFTGQLIICGWNPFTAINESVNGILSVCADTGNLKTFLFTALMGAFVILVRSSGGNNPQRHLLIAGYATDVDMTCDEMFQMPEDSAGRCAVSVHYYTPSTFCILEEDADWGKAKTTWGSPRDQRILEKDMEKLQTRFLDNGIPVIIAVWLMCQIEKRLHKVVPAMFDLFVTPLVSVFVTGYLTLAAIGPVFTKLENGIITGVQTLITLPYGIGSFIMGGLYAVTVVAGIHHMYTLIDLGQLARYGYTYWLPLASAANVAQGGAALAVALKSKDTKVKSMALPSALSACMGITEPAIFGVNLRYFKPFLGGLLGGACGAWYASIVGLGATGTGVTGIFGILLHLHMPLQYIIMMAISFGVSFAVTWLIWSSEEVKA